MFKKILIPLDGSVMAEAVLPDVRELASAFSAEIVLLHVNVPIASQYYPGLIADVAELEQDINAEANSYVHKIASTLQDRGLQVTTMGVNESAVADAILNYADQQGVDLIAMSTHGRSGIGRWLLGSTADRVIHGSKIPVLLVRPDLSGPK